MSLSEFIRVIPTTHEVKLTSQGWVREYKGKLYTTDSYYVGEAGNIPIYFSDNDVKVIFAQDGRLVIVI